VKKLICLLFLVPLLLQAQQTYIDSLVNVLETQRLSIDEELDLYDEIAEYYSQTNPEKSLFYGREGLLIAEKYKNKRMIARNNLNIGSAYSITSLDSAMPFLDRALALSEEIKDKAIEAQALSVMGVYYSLKAQNDKALEYYLKSLALYEKLDNKVHAARLMINIGTVYAQQNQTERHLYYLQQAQATIEAMDVKFPQLETAIYELLGGYYLRTADYAKALEYTLIALDLSRENDMIRYEIVTTQYLAGIYSLGFQDHATAEKYALECVKAAESTGSKEYMIAAWNVQTRIYLNAGRYKEGKNIALKIWDMDSTSLLTSGNTARSLATCYMYEGEADKALYYFSKMDTLRMKVSEDQLLKSMADMEVKYETEKKVIRIAALESQSKLYIGLGIAVSAVLLLSIGLLFYRHRSAVQRQKIAEQQIKQLEQEKELIATRSALDAEKAEREIIARDLHDGVGAMLSVVKNNMDIMKSYSIIENVETDYFYRALDILDKSIVELRRVAHHIMPAMLVEKGLFTALDDFCRSIPEVEFHFAEPYHRFDPEKELVLYRCAYELINNALRHAGASHIDVHLNMNEKTIYLSVVDNGCGFDPQTAPMGMGINNMRIRLSAFGGRIDIYSDQGKGTEANIELDL